MTLTEIAMEVQYELDQAEQWVLVEDPYDSIRLILRADKARQYLYTRYLASGSRQACKAAARLLRLK